MIYVAQSTDGGSRPEIGALKLKRLNESHFYFCENKIYQIFLL
ncbi:MAG: hypothetical protein Q8M94_03920 [Ignavibacteria bacterium]|nr:hypothetical protein [Ignavibacteria bacterium]